MKLDKKISEKMNALTSQGIPFLFILDFDLQNSLVLKQDEIQNENILFHLNNYTNATSKKGKAGRAIKKAYPVKYQLYKDKFNSVQKEIHYGNSYLLNLSFKTEIDLAISLEEIFFKSTAPYKLYLKDKLVLFSPETFIKIRQNRIFTYPMKGTMVKENEKSYDILLNDTKESAEHATITDLLRNDLSKVAKNVEVERYRYIDEIITEEKTILQVSSEISGEILPEYIHKPGDIFNQILPAGSVTGAPKQKTIDIIKSVEDYQRGNYTGVFGFFDGENIDSAVMIRYIEKEGDKYFYKSGGGITHLSDCKKEYQELIDKIYVPLH